MSFRIRRIQKIIKTNISMKFTNSKRKDGFGAQYQNVIWNIIFCELKQFDYFYKPFVQIKHNYNNEENWLEDIEKFINLRNNYSDEIIGKKTIPLTIENVYPFIERNIVKVSTSKELKKIKALFFENKLKIFTSGFNVAIHIRRPNIHDNRIEGGNTPDCYYLNLINIIRDKYRDKNPIFHIYSQGDINNFSIFSDSDIVFHINSDMKETFFSLASADILCTSASSFSYTAAMLSEGIIYYHKFWHRPFPTWTTC